MTHTDTDTVLRAALPSPSPEDMLRSIVGHLGAALCQSLPSDDQIILGHVRCAEETARHLYQACLRGAR